MGDTMSASNSTSNLKLPVFSDDDIPTWLGDWNDTVNVIDSIVGFKKAQVTLANNLTGVITCVYNKVLKLMEIQGQINNTSGTFGNVQVIGTLPNVLKPKEDALIKDINNAFIANSEDDSAYTIFKLRISTNGQLSILGKASTEFTIATIQGFIQCSDIW